MAPPQITPHPTPHTPHPSTENHAPYHAPCATPTLQSVSIDGKVEPVGAWQRRQQGRTSGGLATQVAK
eukprot:352226-Chlamydomonas_euryale.AAC.6